MANKEFLGDQRRRHEEEYVQKHEQQLIDKLRQRRGLAERTGVADQEILRDLEMLGYTPETVALLHVVPLLQTAWAEGGVSDRERRLIVEAARARGIETGSDADHQLATWLTTRPSADVFDKTLKAIRAILQARPSEERDTDRRDLLSYCTAIASASGGILGFGKVSQDEQRVLECITQELERTHGRVALSARLPGEGPSLE